MVIKRYYKQCFIVLLSSGLFACAGAASDPDSSRPDCIYQSSIRGYTVLDEANLIVEGSSRRSYHVRLQRRAFGLNSSWSIAFRSPTGRICASFSELIFKGDFEREAIRIASIKELTKDEEEFLLIQYGKKKPEIEHTPAPAELPGAEVEELDPDANDS
jgi:hypothetical protein